MSWLETPVQIIPALNRLTEAIVERYHYMFPAIYIDNDPGIEFLSPPATPSQVRNRIDYIKMYIARLYTFHFPVKNFGTWGHWRPFDKLSYDSEEVKNAITSELIEVGIDPAGFWMDAPRLISDGTFVRACYHLLNNVILFSVDQLWEHDFVHLLKWNSDSAYDNGSPSVDEIVEGAAHAGSAAYGPYKRQLECALSRCFIQNIYDSRYRQVCPALQGKWKGRYTTSIWKQLTRPLHSDVQEQEHKYAIPGFTEIDFTDMKSDTTLPWHEDILRDLNYYKTWGNYQYQHTMSLQNDRLTEIMLNVENFPPPNYKYFD